MSFDLAAKLRDGYRFEYQGPVVAAFAPNGRSGHGSSEEDAILNIDAQVLGSPPPRHALYGRYSGRILVRADGSEVLLDPSLLVEDPRDREVVLDLGPDGSLVIREDSDAD